MRNKVLYIKQIKRYCYLHRVVSVELEVLASQYVWDRERQTLGILQRLLEETFSV